MELYDLLHAIEKRPAMYLGQPSITQLSAFLAGYFFARRQLGMPETEQEQQFSQFQTWIEQKFNLSSSPSWETFILTLSPDQKAALNQFFVLLHEFCSVDQTHIVQAAKQPLAS